MTGVYMLGSAETALLHLAYFIGIYFLVIYTSSFMGQLQAYLHNEVI